MARPRKEDTKAGEESFNEEVGVVTPLDQAPVVDDAEKAIPEVKATPVIVKSKADIRKDLAIEEARLSAALAEVKKQKAGTVVVEYATVDHMELVRRNRELKKNRKPSQKTEIAKIMRSLMKTPGSNPFNPIVIGKGK